MPTLAELYPELYGSPADTLAQNKPGLATSIKGALGSYPAGLGRVLEDEGFEDIGRGLRQYGEGVQARNPSSPASQSFEGFMESPWQGTKEIVGQGLGYTLPALLPYVGPMGRALGTAGSAVVGTGVFAVPSYGHIRATQDQTGQHDVGAAYGGALATGAIEQIGGVQRFFHPGVQGVVGNTPRHLLQEMLSTPLRTGLSTANRVALGEGAEEIAQSPIQQYAGGQDPWQAEQIHDTLFGGFAGYVGGMLPFGAGAGVRRAGQHMGAQGFVDQTLGNPNAGMDLQMDALEIQQQFTGDQDLRAQQLAALNEMVYQGMLRGEPVNMLQTKPPMPDVMEAPWHAGLGAMPQGAPIETDYNRAAGILQTASQLPEEQWDSQMVRDVEMASALLQRSLPPQQYEAFVQNIGLSGDGRAQPVTPPTRAPRGSAPPVTGQPSSLPPKAQTGGKATKPAYASPYEQAYVESGGIYSPVKAKLGQAKTNEEALAIVRDVLENKKPSQKVMQALEELHKKLSGQTMTQYMREKERGDPRAPGPVTITKGDPNAQANVPVQEMRQEAPAGQVPGQAQVSNNLETALQAVDADEKAGGRLTFMPSDWGSALSVRRPGASIHDEARQALQQSPHLAALVAEKRRAKDAARQTPLQGAAVVEKARAEPVQAVQTKASTQDQGAGREADRQQGQAQQVRPWEEQEPEEVQNFVLQKVADKVGVKKALIAQLTVGWGQERSLTFSEVADRMKITRQRAQQIWKDLSRSGGAIDQVMSEHGIEQKHIQSKEVVKDAPRTAETLGDRPEPNIPSSLGQRLPDSAAGGITDPDAEAGDIDRNTGFTTGDISKVNSSNITGELSTAVDKKTGDVTDTGTQFTPDQEGQANERAAAFEQAAQEGDAEGEAITVWDSYAHIQASQGEKMRNWTQLAQTDRGRETQKAWVEFYTKQKEVANEKKRDAGMLRRLRETLKKAYYSRDISYADFLEQSGNIEQVSFGSNPFLLDAIRRRFAAGLGPMITEKLHGVFVVDNLPGDAGAGKFDELGGKYLLTVKRSVWELRPGSRWDMMLERLFHHEIEHILDDSAQGTFGNYSSDPTLKPGGIVYEEVSSLWITDRGLFAYPMDTAKYKGIEDVQQKELYAQIMSAYHTPALRERLKKFPMAYKFAEIYDEEIRTEVAARSAGTRAQGSAAAGQAGGRVDAALDTRDDGLPDREAFKPQLHEGFAKAVDEVEAAIKSGDPARKRAALNKTLPIGRTPVVLRAVLQIDGSKPFRKSEFVIGNGSTVYLKGSDQHTGSQHRWQVPVETLKRLPELIADPVAVYRSSQSSSDQDSYKIVLDTEVDGRPVIAAVRPNRPQQEFRGETAHFTVTVFPLGNGYSQMQTWNEQGLLRYYDDKRAPAGMPGTNPQGLTSARGTKPDFSVGATKSPVKVTTKSQIEGTPKVQWSKGLEESGVFSRYSASARRFLEGRFEDFDDVAPLAISRPRVAQRASDALKRHGVYSLVKHVTDGVFSARIRGGYVGKYIPHPTDYAGLVIVDIDQAASEEDALFTTLHELSHTLDHGREALYSKLLENRKDVLDELNALVVESEVRPIFSSAKAWVGHVMKYPYIDLEYDMPLNLFLVEVFAQVQGMYMHPTFRPVLAKAAPLTMNFLEDINHELRSLSSRLEKRITRGVSSADKPDFVRARGEAAAQRRPFGFEGNYRPTPEASSSSGIDFSQGLAESMRDYPAELKPGAGMVRDYAKDAVTNWVKKGLQAVVFSHDLANIAVKEGLSSAKGFFDLINGKAAKRIELEAQVDRIMTAAADLTDRTAVNDFLRDSTRGQKWGYVPSWKPDVEVDSVLEQRYNRLSELGKKTVDAVFRRGEESYAEKQRLVNQEINAEFDVQLQKAGTQDERDAIEKARAKQIRTMGRVLPKMQGPYAPFKRFGNYVSVAKSEAYLDAVAMNDTKQVEELQQDDRHYLVEFHDSFPAAKARARQLQPFFHSAKGFERQQLHREVQELPWGAIAKVKQHVADMPDDAQHKAALSRLLTDIYLTMLSEGSARKAELRRRGIHGEERNMLQSFAAQGRADAHFISALEKNGEIQKQISAMQTEAKGDEENRNRVLNEILARYAQAIDYRPTPWTNKAMAMTSFWMLVTTPSYYLQNSTQPFMLTLPVLSGRFGNGAAWAALTKAYKDVGRFFRDVGHGLDIDKLPLPEDERAMLRTLRDQGKIDLTIAQDLGRWSEGEGLVKGNLDKITGGRFGNVLRKIWAAPHQVEMLNRVTSAIAAYRLSKGSLEYTSKIIDDTHGNYAASNAPRFMHANAALRLVTQFRKFQLIQISLLGKTLFNAFKGASPQERAAAKATLGWLLAHHMVMAGALGLPTANLIGWLLSAAFGDDDEPNDFERMARQAIGDEDLANLILRGVPAGLGLDVSGRIGMGTAFALLPFSKVDLLGKRDAMESVAGAAGAFPSVLLGISEGADYLRRGDIYKGFELMLPRGLRDALRSYRFATEGISQKNNDVVMKPSELSMFDVMSQAVGLPSTALQARSRRVGDVFETTDYYKDRTGTIKHRYATAYRENDLEEMRDLREEWAQVAAAMRRQGLKPQPLSNLLKAPREQAKREKETIEGVQTRKSNREFVRRGAEL